MKKIDTDKRKYKNKTGEDCRLQLLELVRFVCTKFVCSVHNDERF